MVEIKNVSYQYAGNELAGGCLKNINLTIQKGECIVLCGRSGCGKTTLTRLLNRLIPEYFKGQICGEITINNVDISRLNMYEVSEKVGSVFQNPKTQFFNVDVDSEIAFGLENRAMPSEQIKRKVNQVIEDFGIQKLTGKSIFELSGGEKQKIAFASVYAMNPDFYLLDEPSSNLDMETIKELKRYITEIKQQQKTVIVAEHRIHYLMDIADRIIYLENGEIRKDMTYKDLKEISPNIRMSMGLRAIDMKEVHPFFFEYEKKSDFQIEVQDVNLYHKKISLIQGISFLAKQGEVIAITGRNGSGKTTFLRTLCGLHKNYTGKFLMNGKRQDERTRKKAAYLVMQDVNYELFADSVRAECTLGIRKPDYELIDRTLEGLGLSEYKEKHPNTLSGGQKQRVAVAVSIICEKHLLAFDEPTSGLDYDSMRQVAELIRKLSKDKIIFIVTHDYEFICQACSRIIHFNNEGLDMDLPVISQNEEQIKKVIGIIK